MTATDDLESVTKQLRNIPKAELHVHLEGTVSHGTLLKLAEINSVDLQSTVQLGPYEIKPPSNVETGIPDFADFPAFISYYVKIAQCIKTENDIVTICDDYIASAIEQGIVASEIYFTPTTFVTLGTPLKELFAGLRTAQDRARQVFNHRCAWIFDIVRSIPGDGSATLEYAKEARALGVNVVGIGLAGYEHEDDVSRFAPVFDRALESGFVCLAHAGETAGPESIRQTMFYLAPSRIGHGVRASEDPMLLGQLAQLQIPLEVSPWSNIKLKVYREDDHPVGDLIEQGLNVILAADDPGIFGKSLLDNYLFAYNKGVSMEALTKMAQRSLELITLG